MEGLWLWNLKCKMLYLLLCEEMTDYFMLQMAVLLPCTCFLWYPATLWDYADIWQNASTVSVPDNEKTVAGKVQSREGQNACREKDTCFNPFPKVWNHSHISCTNYHISQDFKHASGLSSIVWISIPAVNGLVLTTVYQGHCGYLSFVSKFWFRASHVE